jgi:hypothetical protein
MTRTVLPRPGRTAGAAGKPVRAVALAFLAATGAGVLWLALSTSTGLIFHLMPGAPVLAGAWAYRWREGRGPAPWLRVALILVAATFAASAAVLTLVAAGRPLDDPAVTAAVAAAGALLAAAWLRWPGARTDDAARPDSGNAPDSRGGVAER